jgi:GTP cyclohydrolase I
VGQPITTSKEDNVPDDNIETMESAYATIIDGIGEDLSRDGLLDTPKRAAKAMKFLTHGYNQTVELYSMCEHHVLPFIGKCHVAYIPGGKVLGLSKVARIVDMYARRLQIQESLTTQIARSVMDITGAAGVGVIIEAKHMCMMMRGVQKQNSVMRTSSLLGCFRDNDKTRAEFLSLVNVR